MSLLSGFRVVQIGQGFAAAVCGRLLAVSAPMSPASIRMDRPFWRHISIMASRSSHRCAGDGRPYRLRRPPDRAVRASASRCAPPIERNGRAGVHLPFGQSGPKANDPGSDLTSMYSSGIAGADGTGGRSRGGADPAGGRAVGVHRGAPAACAGMHAAQQHMSGAVVDVHRGSAGDDGDGRADRRRPARRSRSRKRMTDGNGATSASCRRATATPRSRRARIVNGRRGSS